MVKGPNDTRQAVIRGGFAGVTAGVVLTLMMTVMSAAAGKDVWYGIKGAAAPFLRERAMDPGFDLGAVVLGLICHLAVSAVWGILFAILFYGFDRITKIVGGVLWGFAVWIGMYYLVLPAVGLASMQNDAPVMRAIMFHLFFSVAMTAAYMVYPRLFPHGGSTIGRSAHAV
jgi:uncharacterized membrane protein YagU involved in acid resistance